MAAPGPATERAANPAPPAEVDLRLLQANERTLLAWLRTGIALVAFGFVVVRLGMWMRAVQGTEPPAGTGAIGVGFTVLGTLANAAAVLRFLRVRQALKAGRPIAQDVTAPLFGVVVTAASAGLIAYLIATLR